MPATRSPGRLLFVAMLSGLLVACQTAEPASNPFWHPEAYVFDVSTAADSSAPNQLQPDVTGGKGKGAARGAGMGLSSCAEGLSDVSGDPGPIGLLLILMLPICAAVGGVAGAATTPSVKAVNKHLAASVQSLATYAPREMVAQKIADSVGPRAAWDPDQHRLQVLQGPVPDDAEQALLKVIVVDVGLVGEGINPDLRLAAKLQVCGFNETGAMVIGQEWQVHNPYGRKVRSWDSTNEQRWNRDVDSLVRAAVKQVNKSVKKGGVLHEVVQRPDQAVDIDDNRVGFTNHPCFRVAPPRTPPGRDRMP